MAGTSSPLTGSGPVTFLYSIDASRLVSDYMKIFGIDIRKYLHGIDSVSVINATGPVTGSTFLSICAATATSIRSWKISPGITWIRSGSTMSP
jgi:hypothetical protein